MLTLGPGSVCDICIEAFGGPRVASAIVCGHVFCSECIDKLRSALPTANHPDPNYKPCPLCRHTFDTRTYIRLHVDHDNNPRPAIRVTAEPTVSKEDAHTVQCLLERMINISKEGSSEEESRQCITEMRTFLQRQKDAKQFIELRACFRMLVYTVDIRTTNRQLQAQKTDLEVSLNRVREEKAEVERKARDERDLALSVEKSLQDHARLTRDGYEAMIILRHYNRVATELNTIREHLQHSCCDDSNFRHDQSTRELASRMTQELTAYHDEYVRRDEHVAAGPGNFMVSPLAAYSALPTCLFDLPEESEVEMPPSRTKSRSRSPTCSSLDQSAGRAVPYPSTHQSGASHIRSATLDNQLVSSSEPCKSVHLISSDPSVSVSATKTELEAASIDRADNRSRITRNRKYSRDHSPHNYSLFHEESAQSSPSLHTPGSISRLHDSGSLSVDETTAPAGITSLATTSSHQVHPSSPLHMSGSTSKTEHRESINKEKTPVVATTPPAPTSESPQTQAIRNHMLQNLLQDTIPISGSFSQINPCTSSPSSSAMPRHESLRSDEQKGSGLGYYTLPQPTPSVLAERRELHRQESLRKSQARDTTDEEMIIPPLTPVPSRPTHQSYDHAPAPTYDPMNVPISSASSAAKAKARERAEKAMRDKRTEKDKDSIRKRAEREERRRSKRGEAWYPSYPGESSSSYKHNFHGATASDRLQQGNSSSRHISSYDLPPPPYTSASQRSSGSGRGRYVEKYTSSHRNKYTPFRILSVTPRA